MHSVLRDYELTFIVRPQVEEEALRGLVDKVKGWITAEGGAVDRTDMWGRRRLAYSIRKEREGQYVFMLTRTNPAQIAVVERSLRLQEEILRYLFVRVEAEPKPAEAPAEQP